MNVELKKKKIWMYLAPRISGKCLWIFTQQDYFRLQTRIYETAFNFHRGSLIKPTFLGHSLCPWNWLGIGVFISERSQFYFCLVYKARSGIRITVATEINREGRRASKLAQGWRTHLPMQETREMQVPPLGRKIPGRREWLPTLGEFHGQRRLAGYSP